MKPTATSQDTVRRFWRVSQHKLVEPRVCQICDAPFSKGELIVDTKLRSRTTWFHGCADCAIEHGTPGLGTAHEYIGRQPS